MTKTNQTKPEESWENMIDKTKDIIVDNENRAYKDFNPDYFVPGEMRAVGVVVDRAMEKFVPLIERFISQAKAEQRREDIEWFKKLLIEPNHKTIQCPASNNPEFRHWVGKHGLKSICYQCGKTIYTPKTKTKFDLLSQLEKGK